MSDTEKEEPSEFEVKLAEVRGSLEDLPAKLEMLATLHAAEVFELTEELDAAEARADEAEKAEQEDDAQPEDECTTAMALDVLFRTSDGRRLIERAFLANPGRTAMELSYLKGDAIRGEIEVSLALTKETSTPDAPSLPVPAPPPKSSSPPTPLRRMPRT